MTKAYKTWVDRIESGVFTKAQCGQFARAVVAIAEGGTSRGKRTNLTQEEARMLVDAIKFRGGVRLTSDHAEQGFRWFERYGRKVLGLGERFHEEVVREFDHFTYNGEAADSGTTSFYVIVPVWRIHLRDGRMYDYYATSWQSGGDSRLWSVDVPAGL